MLIIKDMKGWFWATYPIADEAVSLDVSKLIDYFSRENFEVELTTYDSFDYEHDYTGYFVLYGSAEDYCGGTKSYIEDVLVWLEANGAYLIPKFQYFRAHDNKVMMELLRKNFHDPRLKTIQTRTYSSLEVMSGKEKEFPLVIKTAAGAGGGGVFLARSQNELQKIAKKVSRLVNERQYYYLRIVNIKQRLLKKQPVRINNTKFIVQTFIQNLTGDYKVLVFGDHYFVLHRLNRDGDFRASGSGKFTNIIENELEGLLDFARLCKNEIPTPHLSLDICFDGHNYHLIEFQCLTFGFKAMSLSDCYFIPFEAAWKRIDGNVSPEEEFCQAVINFLQITTKNYKNSIFES